MISKIDGKHFLGMIDYGVRNLTLYRDRVNALNVFPVPDGDTGTNMVMTLESGFKSIDGMDGSLSGIARRFSGAVILGARGNSGVIISQFFKGFSECFFDLEEADPAAFSFALDTGVKCAYKAVSHPVEGTVLTVLREASESVHKVVCDGEIKSIDALIDLFLDSANESLRHTPDILPVLKSAGVVDSGGAGIIYVFDGIKKYLAGEEISKPNTVSHSEIIDYSKYNSKTKFEFGYCTELLIQLTDGSEELDYSSFKSRLETLGESVVTALEGDKVKVHIHTHTPEQILNYCHRFGEFLNIKIENMSVQHHELNGEDEDAGVQIASINQAKCEHFAVVAVAHEPSMTERFSDMGADAVISASHHCPPSASDFIEVFTMLNAKNILVFPNSKNTVLAAEQAEKMFEGARVHVFDTKSDAECYSALPMIDYDIEDVDEIIEGINSVIENLYIVNVTKATKDAVFSGIEVHADNYVAMAGHDVVSTDPAMQNTVSSAISICLSERECDVMNVFTNGHVDEVFKDNLMDFVKKINPLCEVDIVETQDDFFDVVLSFE